MIFQPDVLLGVAAIKAAALLKTSAGHQGETSSKFPKTLMLRGERERGVGGGRGGINAGLIVSHCVVPPYVVGRRLMACKQAKFLC